MKKYHICSAKKETVQALLQQAGVHMRFPCGGQGKCGKCKITVTGDVLPPTKSEKALLSEDELDRGVRLACSALAEGDVDIILPEKESVHILQDSRTQKQFVLDHEMSEDDYGIAVDIGTTTVVCALFDSIHRNPVDRISELNQQTEFGADVISRLMYCQGKGTETMHHIIVEQIRHMIQILCKANRVEPEQIRKAAETIGLLPSGMSEKTIVLGNSALNGASMLLLNSSFRKTVADLKDHVDYIELSGSMSFQEKYLSEMGFPS